MLGTENDSDNSLNQSGMDSSNLNPTRKRLSPSKLAFRFQTGHETALSLKSIKAACEAAGDPQDPEFFQRFFEVVGVHYQATEEDLAKVPAKGALVAVANQPFGGLEALILGSLLTKVRTDVRFLGNHLIQEIPSLQPWVIPVKTPKTRGKKAPITTSEAMQEAVDWLNQGGMLVTFPAGKVSQFNLTQRKVVDPPWKAEIGELIHLTSSNAMPLFFPGRNSALVMLMGMLHPKLRTLIHPKEVSKKNPGKINVFVGKPIIYKKLARFEAPETLINYLRVNTYFLKNRQDKKKRLLPAPQFLKPKETLQETIIDPLPIELIKEEIGRLPEESRMVDKDDFTVFVAEADQIPGIIQEIGRLREVTFREVMEGTGKSIDLDRFDLYYKHLFLWDKVNEQLVGAYRLGLSDQILNKFGADGLYTSTLFKYKLNFLEKLGKAIEVGRSFIRTDYQKKFGCLSLIWRGIGEFIVRNPEYNVLFGPVSISQDYRVVSKDLMIDFLRQKKLDNSLSRLVSARNPYRTKSRKGLDKNSKKTLRSSLKDIEDVSVLISEIENDGKGIPILLRHYLKLNATLISFNVDKEFSSAVDGLVVVEVQRTDPKLANRFMGKEGFKTFKAYHGLE